MYPALPVLMHFSTRDKTETADKPAQSQKQQQHKWAMCRLAWFHSSLPSSICLQVYILDLLCCCMSFRWAAFLLQLHHSIACHIKNHEVQWCIFCCPCYANSFDLVGVWDASRRSLLLKLWMSTELAQTPQLFSQRMPETAVTVFWYQLWYVHCVVVMTRRNCSCCLPRSSSLFVMCCYAQGLYAY